tara:strand:- start:421 stop:723 length:303 start_codon:yes stop_codon:yes gene_type:complete
MFPIRKSKEDKYSQTPIVDHSSLYHLYIFLFELFIFNLEKRSILEGQRGISAEARRYNVNLPCIPSIQIYYKRVRRKAKKKRRKKKNLKRSSNPSSTLAE